MVYEKNSENAKKGDQRCVKKVEKLSKRKKKLMIHLDGVQYV